MLERLIVTILALLRTAKNLPKLMRKAFSEHRRPRVAKTSLDQVGQSHSEAQSPRTMMPSYSELLKRASEEKARRREAKRQASQQ